MKSYLDLVPSFAKAHQKQNRMSVFCIVLAVILVTAIFGMADMFIRSQMMQAIIDGGNFHITVKNITDEEAALIARRADVKAAARYGVLNFRGEQGYNISGKNAIIVGCDEEYITELQVDVIDEGRFPQEDDEAMVTKSARDNLGLKIGDKVIISRPKGSALEYRISGFCRNTSKTMGEDSYGFFISTAAFREIYPGKKSTNLEDYNTVLCVQFAKTGQIQNTISRLKGDCGLLDQQVSENTKLLGLLGQSASSFMTQVYLAAGILFLLVLLAGIMMIAGSLNRGVVEKTEFFGLMRCMGATPRQVMKFVYREAVGWCRFAIPAGIGVGLVTIWILCGILRRLSPEYFSAMPIFGISLPSLAAGTAVGLLTVLLAARSPARTASKVSPLTALSGNASGLKPVRKAANTRLFKVTTALGIHHGTASKRNFVLTVLSFSFSVILFLSFSAAIEFTKHTITPLRPWTADLSLISADQSQSLEPVLLEKIKANSAVRRAYGRMFSYGVPVTVNGRDKITDLISYEENQFAWASDYLLDGSVQQACHEVNTGLGVYRPQSSLEVGDIVKMVSRGKIQEIKIVGILSDCPFDSQDNREIIICSEETFQAIRGQGNYTIIDIRLNKGASEDAVNDIRQMAGNEVTFADERMSNESTRGVYYCIWLFLYGFLAVVVLITIFNMINNMALSVAARTWQFGAFRAIGLSIKQLASVIIAEAMVYTVCGAGVGTILGLLFHKLLFEIMISSHWGDSWSIPWSQLGVIVLIMFFSVGLSVYGPIKRIGRMSVAETIKSI